ncbi:ribosome-associated translation inhibitor RaiA [Auritidibacter ignavus]|uniref:Ribosome hibernation promoting factor n=1 Tax=Auritidibacter ignavus TaxID=678932 RepID=A0AAJ6AH47_9MICC|nr:ribosome-associated translation inhibitor RaiA [Auritidibacter ignavus]WGH93306.1 ribosome-associated translation inhibitor RaiA [Auritidibacter ignavus]
MAIDISYVARGASIKESFRDYVEERLEKIESLLQEAQRVEIKLGAQPSHTGASGSMTVELTVHSPKNVVRAEASDDDQMVAFDKVFHKIQERLRRLRERRKSHRKRVSVREITADSVPVDNSVSLVEQVLEAQREEAEREEQERHLEENGEAPVTIRQKVFPPESMSLDDAVDNMELLGHDFYLFIDAESGRPSVAYRRRGWSYGVISLGEDTEPEGSDEQIRTYRDQQASA